MAYQRARIRDTQTGRPATHSAGNPGRAGGNREDTTPGTGPNPPEPAASAAHTRPGHCTRQGSSGAQRHAPAPGLGSLRASPRGSHWRQASSTGPAAPAPRATTHKGGDAVGKRPQPRLRIDALTGEWRNGEAREGRGSEPCEPGGLRHQAGGASWRAPHQDPVGRISPGPTRWPPGAERRLVPAKSNLKPQTPKSGTRRMRSAILVFNSMWISV